MKLSIVIPNYNGAPLLKSNLPKVLEAVEPYDFEIIIVDDFSTDSSLQLIEDFRSENNDRVKLIKNEQNLGFPKSVNKGVKISSGDILILLNTDVSPDRDFVPPILKHFSEDKVFAVGCMDESVEGGKVVERGRGVGKWARGFLVHKLGRLDHPKTLWVSGGSGAFRRSAWDNLGGLDEIYSPFYWEDIDLSYRAGKAGYLTLFEKESVVRHEHEKGAIKNMYSDKQIKKISYRNQIYFVWLNITDRRMLWSHLIWLPYHIFNTIAHGDTAFTQALISAFFNVLTVVKKRNMRKEQNKLTDIEILAPFKEEFSF